MMAFGMKQRECLSIKQANTVASVVLAGLAAYDMQQSEETRVI